MGAEILVFKTLWKSNRALWWRSLLFHSGLYCLVVSVSLQLAGAHLQMFPLLSLFGRLSGFVGLYLVLAGVLGLLWRRWTDIGLKNSTHPADYLQLAAIALSDTLLLFGSLSSGAPGVYQVLRGTLLFDLRLQMPTALSAGLMLACLIVAYVPYSPMAHFIGKYFAFHKVRWDDEPNLGTRFLPAVKHNLGLVPTWSAPHIHGNGKTWAEIAAPSPSPAKGARG